ncbi:hypothetical protein EVAR_96779_1 [Eumeta japonica]|uniref:EB domain-containing protein n=1 Tax=Eumeta variegata TaxID=151549 RepID=A0A4C1WTG2_EUMVA|nr:hypothetical protein EVAR_96779_1 [Eumeta japonica]
MLQAELVQAQAFVMIAAASPTLTHSAMLQGELVQAQAFVMIAAVPLAPLHCPTTVRLPPGHNPASRKEQMYGDPCTTVEDCGFPDSICDANRKLCVCHQSTPATNHVDKCGKEIKIYLSSTVLLPPVSPPLEFYFCGFWENALSPCEQKDEHARGLTDVKDQNPGISDRLKAYDVL